MWVQSCCYLPVTSKTPRITLSTFKTKILFSDSIKMPPHTPEDVCYQRKEREKKKMTSVGKDVEKLESLFIADRNVK